MNPSKKDEVKSAVHVIRKGKQNTDQATNNLALEPEERAQD